ncbi:MAG: thiamine pyrophosphate-binding protein [Lachnospiraceae bacterium]|nr:thiamine pyrophosphate-binding protein [Lachnospiraceae bacterium]
MTTSEYIFKFLYECGCKNVYMVSGSSAMWLTDALQRNKNLNAVCCNHEQAAAMSADGYGRVNGIPGACLVTIGPGATNAVTGVAQAYLDSSPMFIISGQANSRLLKYASETGIRQQGCQSINLEPMVRPITKYFAAVMDADDIPQIMHDAYYAAMEGRRGPVWIDVPIDIQNQQVSETCIAQASKRQIVSTPFHTSDVDKVVELIRNAQKPLILAGYGIRSSNAVSIMGKICEICDIPVVTSRGGLDIIASDSPYYVGRPGSYGDRASHFAIQEADLLLILGSRLSISTIGYYPAKFGKNAIKVMVDIDEKELNKEEVPVAYKIRADLSEFLEALYEKLKNRKLLHSDWLKHCMEYKQLYPTVSPSYKLEEPLNEYYVTSIISECAPESANIIVDTGSVCNIVSQSWKIKMDQRYLISGGLSCMGFWATAMGAFQKDRALIALSGDGSTQMNIQEFATIKYYQIPVKLFIYNNNGYMLIRHNQHNYMNDRFLGVGPDSGVQTPNFCKVADAYGIEAVYIDNLVELRDKVKYVMESDQPVICEIICQEFAPIVPRIASRVMPDGSLKAAEFEDLFPFLDEEGIG